MCGLNERGKLRWCFFVMLEESLPRTRVYAVVAFNAVFCTGMVGEYDAKEQKARNFAFADALFGSTDLNLRNLAPNIITFQFLQLDLFRNNS